MTHRQTRIVWHVLSITVLMLIASIHFQPSFAQSEFAATLEVLASGVGVQRANTETFIAVEIEAIVGVGDVIRTNETGEARITFFADGTDVTLESDTEYRIIEFQGDEDDFQLTVEVLAGQATHRLNRILGASSSYDVETPGMTLAARGTTFAVRVEDSERSGMLVFEGDVNASSDEDTSSVPQEFGIRSGINSELSDVVRASTFAELDAALDGCAVVVTTADDVSINVRVAPSLDATQIGFVSASEINNLVGTIDSANWYRITFEDSFGWVLSSSVEIDTSCAGLRIFPDDHSELTDTPTAEATAEAVSED